MRKRADTESVGNQLAPEDQDKPFVTSLFRGLEVLRAFHPEDSAGLSNNELAERTGLPTSTLSRLTFTLLKCGYLTYDGVTGLYRLGVPVLSLGYACLAALPFREQAQRHMQELADRCGDGVHIALATRVESTMLFLATARAPGIISLRLDVGSRISITKSAVGRAYVAGCAEKERSQFIADIRDLYPPDVARKRIEGIQTAIEQIQKCGFCSDFGEWRSGVNSVAVPFRNRRNGNRIEVFVLGGPASHVSCETLRANYGPKLSELARSLCQTSF